MSEKGIFINELPPITRKLLAEQVKTSTVLTIKEWVTFADSHGVDRQEFCDLMIYQLQKFLKMVDVDKVKPLEMPQIANALGKIIAKRGENNGSNTGK